MSADLLLLPTAYSKPAASYCLFKAYSFRLPMQSLLLRAACSRFLLPI